MNTNLTKYALIDLHLHLDGSLSPEWIIAQAKQQHITLPTEDPLQLLNYISAPNDCQDLNQYLHCFDIPISVLQTPETLTSAVIELMQRLSQQGMLYAEIRFAPQFHTQKTMNQEQAVQAAIQGIEQGLQAVKKSGFFANLILCCMRAEDNLAENLETVRLAKKYLGEHVVAVDLAGAEALFPTENFRQIFDYAKSLNVPFTLHAGEAAGAESVQQALLLGAKRIGHGVRACESEAVMSQLVTQKIPLEMCPCSNLQTKTVADLNQYPLRNFLQRGILATLNTDNMTVSQTSVAQEFALLEQAYQLTENEAKQLLENAINAAFLSAEEKAQLRQKIQALFML